MGLISRQKCASGGGGGGASITINTTAPLQGGDVGTTFDLSWSFSSEAQGDLVVRGPSEWERKAVGSNLQVLTVVGGVPAWANAITYTAGTGLSLSGGNAFSVNYGTTAGTSLQGDRDAGYVHIVGPETITGVKTFDADVVMATTRVIRGTRELVLWAEDSTAIGARLQLAVGTTPTVTVAYLSEYSLSIGTSGIGPNTVAAGLLFPHTDDADLAIAFESYDGMFVVAGMMKWFRPNYFTGADEDLLQVGTAEGTLQNLKLAGLHYVEIRVNEAADGAAFLREGGVWSWDQCALEFSTLVLNGNSGFYLDSSPNRTLMPCDTSAALGTVFLPDPTVSDVRIGRTYVLFDIEDNASNHNIAIAAVGSGVNIDGNATYNVTTDGGGVLLTYVGSLRWTALPLGASTGGGGTLPFFLIGPPNSGPGGSSPPYATLAAAKAAAPAAPQPSLFVVMDAEDGYYTGGFTVDSKPISIVSWGRHNGTAAGTGPVAITGKLSINPGTAGWVLRFNGVKFVNASGAAVEVIGSNDVEVDYSDSDAEGSDEGVAIRASVPIVFKATRMRGYGIAKGGFEASNAAHLCYLDDSYMLSPTGSGIDAVVAENGAVIKVSNALGLGACRANGGTVWVEGAKQTTGSDQPFTMASAGIVIAKSVDVFSSAADLFGGSGSFTGSRFTLSGGVKATFNGSPTVLLLKDIDAKTVQVLTATGNINSEVDYVFLQSTGKIVASLPTGASRLIHPCCIYALDAPLIGNAHDVAVQGGGTIRGLSAFPVPATAAITVIPAVGVNGWYVVAEANIANPASVSTDGITIYKSEVYTQPDNVLPGLFGRFKYETARVAGTTRKLYVELRSTNGGAVRALLYDFTANAYITLSGGNAYLSTTASSPTILVSDDLASLLVDGQFYEVRGIWIGAGAIAVSSYAELRQ